MFCPARLLMTFKAMDAEDIIFCELDFVFIVNCLQVDD